MRNYKVGTPVQVIWVDAKQESRWISPEEFKAMPVPIIVTRGTWGGTTADMIMVIFNMAKDGDVDGIHIPKGCVKSIKVLRES